MIFYDFFNDFWGMMGFYDLNDFRIFRLRFFFIQLGFFIDFLYKKLKFPFFFE